MNVQIIFNIIIEVFLLWLIVKWSSKENLDSLIKVFMIIMFIINLIMILTYFKIL